MEPGADQAAAATDGLSGVKGMHALVYCSPALLQGLALHGARVETVMMVITTLIMEVAANTHTALNECQGLF